VRTDGVDVALCMHVLYHVPDQAAAVAELRRIVRPDGVALLVTNGLDHVREIDELVAEVAGARPARSMRSFKMEDGAAVLGTAFESVVTNRFSGGALDVTDADAVVAYVASVRGLYDGVEEQHYADALDEIRARVDAVIRRDGAFVVTTATGCFVCR
jgi:SAM-dependent methyltransferase